MVSVQFFADGVPITQGSKTAYTNRRTGRPILVESARGHGPWRGRVTLAARRALAARPTRWEPLDEPVRVSLTFYVPRPPSVSRKARPLPDRKPDIDKLERAVFDSLTDARVWVDDGRAVEVWKAKRYADDHPVGVRVLVEPVEVV